MRVGSALAAAAMGGAFGMLFQRKGRQQVHADGQQQLDTDAPRALVIAGPSGVGKGTLIGMLMKAHPDKFGFSVSHTTRAPREGEKDGVHYNFTTSEDMERRIAKGEFLEYARVHGKIYGTSFAAVRAVAEGGEPKCCVLDIDVQGADLVRKAKLPAGFVFIAPPSMEELERRLRGRGTESESDVEKRIANARGEMDRRNEKGLFDEVIVNDDLDETYKRFEKFALSCLSSK